MGTFSLCSVNQYNGRHAHPLGTTNSTDVVKSPEHLKTLIERVLDDNKAEEIEIIDLKGLTSIGDYMVVATGRSNRQVVALADKIMETVKEAGYESPRAEGIPHGDWVVVDAFDVIVHLFRPEVREFYNIEKMWRAEPGRAAHAAP
jgi:ribosome-associated protein